MSGWPAACRGQVVIIRVDHNRSTRTPALRAPAGSTGPSPARRMTHSPPPVTEDIVAAARRVLDIEARALDALEADSVIREALGPVTDEFLKFKRMEWIEYMRHVSEWEVKQYLEFF